VAARDLWGKRGVGTDPETLERLEEAILKNKAGEAD
jgi:hypothetical protein